MDAILAVVLIIGIIFGITSTIHHLCKAESFVRRADRESEYDKMLLSFALFGLCLAGFFHLIGRIGLIPDTTFTDGLTLLVLGTVLVIALVRIFVYIANSFLDGD